MTSPRQGDLVDSVIRTRDRVRKLETKATNYYVDPISGVTEDVWTQLPQNSGWSTYLFARIIADIVTISGSFFRTSSFQGGSPTVLPEKYRPPEDMYFQTATVYRDGITTIHITPDGMIFGAPLYNPNVASGTAQLLATWPRIP